ncbi:hypothetical protein C1T20_06860 [Paenibacillus polymyxa]|nr:hypothetical protein C1T20_06860 [Paenibacillus polymyxa]
MSDKYKLVNFVIAIFYDFLYNRNIALCYAAQLLFIKKRGELLELLILPAKLCGVDRYPLDHISLMNMKEMKLNELQNYS